MLDLQEAWAQCRLLEAEEFDIDTDDLSAIEDFADENSDMEAADMADGDEVEVMDPDADDEEDLEDSYVGKIICQCPVCKSMIYKDRDDISPSEDEESEGLINVGEECPYCQSSEGFKIIGQVQDYEEEPTEEPVEDEVPAEEGEDLAPEADATADEIEDDEMEESLRSKKIRESMKRRRAAKALKEGCDGARCDTEEDRKARKKEQKKRDAAAAEKPNGIPVKEGFDELRPGETPRQWAKRMKAQEQGMDEAFLGDPDADACSKKKKRRKTEDVDQCVMLGDDPETMDEALENINLTTDNENINISCSPKDGMVDDIDVAPLVGADDVIGDVDQESQDIITGEQPAPENLVPTEDVALEDIDDEGFENVAEGYLKRAYNNVDSFKLTEARAKGDTLKLEGVINFKSGKSGKTTFVFESYKLNKATNTAVFRGFNEQINPKSKHAFRLSGKLFESKFTPRSMRFSYMTKSLSEGVAKSQRIRGTVFNKVR